MKIAGGSLCAPSKGQKENAGALSQHRPYIEINHISGYVFYNAEQR
jgi:hypothetical protein